MYCAGPAQDAAPAVTRHVAIALLGVSVPPADELRAELAGLAPDTSWAVTTGMSSSPVDIALCDGIAAVASAAARWPGAGIIAAVEPADDGSMVVAALEAGAHVCLRKGDTRVAAAYVHSVARRRELTADSVAQR